MPTVFSHAAVGFIAAKGAAEVNTPNARVAIASMALAALPDVDALFIDTIPYSHPFGHRGITHSLFFAAIIGVIAALALSKLEWSGQHSFKSMSVLFAIVIASHGFFDAMTNGGLGIAFFAPFDNTRYFFPWRPIPVSPLSAQGLANARGLRVIGWEAGMFWTFAAAALVWTNTIWRMALAGALAAAGVAFWVFALSQSR